MISRAQIAGFKRFVDEDFQLAPLTMFAGLNGSGKSSAIHALLLAREAWKRDDGFVELNGPYGLELGTFFDVVNSRFGDNFAVQISNAEGSAQEFRFFGSELDRFAIVQQNQPDPHLFTFEPRSFQYLSAERLGPRIVQNSAATPEALMEVGFRGEYCAQVLDHLGGTSVEEPRLAKSQDLPRLLKAQTEYWLSRLTRPLQLDTERIPSAGIYTMRFRTGEDWVKPTNMGFGVTFSLPMIVAGLTAPRGGMLIIENPEAHLHPAGQSQAGVFLATLAASGVQVVAETHSDHVLNGVRRAIGELGILDAHMATAYHFSSQEGTHPERVEFNSNGTPSSWPEGFFDQFQLDVAALTRVRRRR